ncbi:MAG: sodium:solute symporter [Verrucomicrobia bacterium]|nr:sodium:solute symporter [Verrucomicrobiota bacterium]
MEATASHLNAADWTVIVVYLVGIVGLGVWAGRGQKTTRDYFLGREEIPWWGVGLSIVATETSALTFIGVPAMAYGGDLALLQIIVGYVIARVVLAVVLVPHYFKGEIYSAYQLLEHAFGPPARRLAGGFFLVAGTLGAGVRVFVSCIPIQLMLGVDILTAILIFVGLSLVYTYLGGIKTVVWTDAAQFLLFVGGGVFALFYIPTLLEGGWSTVLDEARAAGKLNWLNLELTLGLPFNLWMGLIGATVHILFSHGADQLIVQQVLTCKSVAGGRRALILSAVIIFPLFLVFLLTGALLWVYYQHHPLGIAIPETTGGLKQNDYVFPIFILTVVPHWLKGFLIVAVLSAAMSSVSAALAALSSVSMMDILRGLSRHPRSEAYYFRLSRYATVFWAAMLVLVAFVTRQAAFVFNLAFSLAGLTSGAMLGGLILAVFFRRGASGPVMAGMTSAFVAMVALQALFPGRVAWPWYTLMGAVVTLSVTFAIRRGTRQVPR